MTTTRPNVTTNHAIRTNHCLVPFCMTILSRIKEETKDKMMQKGGTGKELCTKQNQRRQRLGKRRQMSSPKESYSEQLPKEIFMGVEKRRKILLNSPYLPHGTNLL
ncbi:hypothetical protein NPIL_503001 [Nephila pilipes]|uniref:Uncharacterized protein n=1 Tax=Nephila pilipes TaxID=299642 RepID=A0A8X6TUB2_NEPPI|nr:hypothetical protein NPIL_503001 [Nephila pilipes]